MNERIKKLKREAPNELKLFLKAGGIFEGIDGMSAQADKRKLDAILEVLDFTPSTQEGRELKSSMISKAKAKSKKGLFGNGTFLIS